MKKRIGFQAVLFSLAVTLLPGGPAHAANSYPTVAVTDYVLGCMIANGRTRETLERCSCSIDVISSIISYEDYEAAETFQRMGQVVGERGVIFRQSAPARAATGALKRAQAEADMRCF